MSRDGKFCQFYAYDEHGRRRIFAWKVTNRKDAIHCLVRVQVPSGWYVERVKGLVQKNERIYSNMRDPSYTAPHEKPWWHDILK